MFYPAEAEEEDPNSLSVQLSQSSETGAEDRPSVENRRFSEMTSDNIFLTQKNRRIEGTCGNAMAEVSV